MSSIRLRSGQVSTRNEDAKRFLHQKSLPFNAYPSINLRVINADRFDPLFEQLTAKLIKEDKDISDSIKALLKMADLGITDISVNTKQFVETDFPAEILKDEFRSVILEQELFEIQLRHITEGRSSAGVLFSMEDESLGTRRLFGLSGPWFQTLYEGFTIFVDELDSSLHPHLVKFLVELFYIPSINLWNAQLVFNTHDTALLDFELFRRDQIWLVEKDNNGASTIYPLLEYSPRKNEALERGYLQGRYGGVPFLEKLYGEFSLNVKV